MKNFKRTALKIFAFFAAVITAFAFSACGDDEIPDTPNDSGGGFSRDDSVRVSSVSFKVLDEASRAEYEKKPLSEVIESALSSIVTLTVQTESSTIITTGIAVANSDDNKETYIVASHQNVAGAKSAVAKYEGVSDTVTFSTSERTLTPVGTDPQTDICVIRLSGYIPAAVLYDDELYAGESVAAVGNLLADGNVLSSHGIISGVNYLADAGEGKKSQYLLTDAYVKTSGSGGVFLERGGFWAGFITSLSEFKQVSISAVVPAATIKYVANEIIANGYVKGRYKLGLSVADNRYSWGITTGVEVTDVAKDGSLYADGNGLKTGDILRTVTISGSTYNITTSERLFSYLYGSEINVGDIIIFSVERGKTQITVSVEIKQYDYFGEN